MDFFGSENFMEKYNRDKTNQVLNEILQRLDKIEEKLNYSRNIFEKNRNDDNKMFYVDFENLPEYTTGNIVKYNIVSIDEQIWTQS